MRRLVKSAVVMTPLLLFLRPDAWADDGPCRVVEPIHFPPKANSAVVNGAVARGEIACWSLMAKAGQHARLSITSVENNAVFQFYAPGWKLARDADDLTVEGKAFAHADEGDDAKTWSGVLSADGANLIVVGSTRGGATYHLTVSITGR